MTKGFEAISQVTIHAPLAQVWDVLTNPDKVRTYLHGTNLATDW
ncbi:MAG: ATPase, partial [Chloroflexi bacterium]